jgi:hypothetical protein
LRILLFPSNWRRSNWRNMDLGLLVLELKFLVLMINTFANTLPNRTTFGEVSNSFHIHELFFEFGGEKLYFYVIVIMMMITLLYNL